MEEILEKLAYCVEFGKINLASPYPPDMRGQEGADELTKKALEMGVPHGRGLSDSHGDAAVRPRIA